MKWAKLKNCILLILIILNLVLAAMVGYQNILSRNNDRKMRDNVRAVLAANQIEYIPKEVPGRWSDSADEDNLIDGATALSRFLISSNKMGYVCSQILSVREGYTQDKNAGEKPAWFVQTDTTPGLFSVDAESGTVATVTETQSVRYIGSDA